ncbi:MAG: hypothetical protein COT74_11460 [Bdellovibrionales bacterium CG10_big_fil_rev_8_21_14_0_10_45_34]|nr:MAG: hypothetical protein COT74_11460 [Bdellovibrionales bacterium CG10_big_fil_rev_8_21_14_0_10_45_34]
MKVAWRKCSTCKKEIQTDSIYYKCSVSTCNRKRTGLAFCCIPCWDAHLPFANHKDAGAIESTSPNKPEGS